MDRDTGARNRHNAPYWVATRAVRGEPLLIEAASLREVGWDYIDAPSAARGVVALLDAASPPRRFLYELAIGRCVPHGELVASLVGEAFTDATDEAALLEQFRGRFGSRVELLPPGGGGEAAKAGSVLRARRPATAGWTRPGHVA